MNNKMCEREYYLYAILFFLLGYAMEHHYITLQSKKFAETGGVPLYFAAFVILSLCTLEKIYIIYKDSQKAKNELNLKKVYWGNDLCRIIQSLLLLYIIFTSYTDSSPTNPLPFISVYILMEFCPHIAKKFKNH